MAASALASRLSPMVRRRPVVRVWDPVTGQQHAVLAGHTDWVRAVAPDGTWLANASDHTTPQDGAGLGPGHRWHQCSHAGRVAGRRLRLESVRDRLAVVGDAGIYLFAYRS